MTLASKCSAGSSSQIPPSGRPRRRRILRGAVVWRPRHSYRVAGGLQFSGGPTFPAEPAEPAEPTRSAGGAELRDPFISCGALGAAGAEGAFLGQLKVIFGLIICISCTLQIEVILDILELL